MSKSAARAKAEEAKSELSHIRIITLDENFEELHRALKKVHHAADKLADAVIELAKE